MMIAIPPKYAVSQVVGFIKGKSAIHLARVYGERKQNYAGQSFWARGYFVSTVGRDERVIREYIRNQEREDQRLDQMNMWKWPATVKVAQSNRGRVSDPAPAALSGSHNKAPGSAGGYLHSHRWLPGPVRPSPIDAFKQHRQLRTGQRYLSTVGLRPHKSSPLELLSKTDKGRRRRTRAA